MASETVLISRAKWSKVESSMRNGKIVAIKTIFDNSRAKHETEMLSKLSHPNIIPVIEIYSECHIVMPLIPITLLDIVEKGPLGEHLMKKYFEQIFSSVAYLHQQGVAHRDIKLENILIDECGKCFLIDFGLACSFQPHRRVSGDVGSEHYAAPEILILIPYVAPLVDVWSLGVCLYTCFTGNFPFHAAALEDYHQRLTHPLFYPDNMSPNLKNLIRHMLVLNPGKRHNMTDVLQHEWLQS